jgi:ABC-2 type transport system permease protein
MKVLFVILRKELAEYWIGCASPQNFYGGLVSIAMILFISGIYMPMQMGHDWIGSITMFLCLIFLVPFTTTGTIIPGSFVLERQRHTLEALLATPVSDLSILLGKIVAPALFGWGSSLASTIIGIVAVGNGASFFLSGAVLSIISFGFLISFLVAIVGVITSFRAKTLLQAQRGLVLSLLPIILIGIFPLSPFVPDAWKFPLIQVANTLGHTNVVIGLAVLLVFLNVALILHALARFQRKTLLFPE